MGNRKQLKERDLGLPISASIRRAYEFDEEFFAEDGRAKMSSIREVRDFAQAIDLHRSPAAPSAREGVKAGDLEALGVLDVVYRILIGLFRDRENPEVESDAVAHLRDEIGGIKLDRMFVEFLEEFPPEPVFQGDQDPEDYLEQTEGAREETLVNLVCVWLANHNTAADHLDYLFDDETIEEKTPYERVFESLEEFFESEPTFGNDDQPLFEMLATPPKESPHSLSDQLQFVQRSWGHLLPEWLRRRLLTTIDVMREEEKALHFGVGAGAPLAEPPDFDKLVGKAKRYSKDSDWMPRLVLVAKNVRVWLTQLSRRYERDIRQLQDIPEEELAKLAERGITGLWLIGLWERSRASERIKRMTGSPDAVSSAYSIDRYEIADDLGGRRGKAQLEEKAWEYGIRLAADMVPNHMGIDSDWVINNPDRFLSLEHSPYPAYSFDGPDLCDDDRVGIYLEDHYYDESDAAVVFKRVDHHTGATRYVYHGNDGTSMPWNDTAQIDFLNPEAREAVVEQILDVAREFPVIRFDAAMTLAKKQIHRLWYPEPGTGGDIPSRAEHGMSRHEFEEMMPEEFWREVVERIAEEAPDTLLLAEAFWQMEGFFVRTLGMHRVYNSAFMNMLRNEDNGEYRELMKETLTFDPQILKRYVNFMNNPDEETAVEQFGKGDKYFGICTLMATMPGLPMFGHGQVEGFEEKYGMDFEEPMLDEDPDRDLVDRHRREIFPLLYRRELFAGVENFRLYDVYRPDGHVDENIFAYSNRFDGDRTLVVYHNRFGDTRGWIRESVPFREGAREEDDGTIETRTLAEGLEVPDENDLFLAFRDAISGLEFIRSASEVARKGLYIELGAYDAHVFLDFREIRDREEGPYARLCDRLAGRGVDNLDAELRRMRLQPVHQAARRNINPEQFRKLTEDAEASDELMEEIRKGAEALAWAAGEYSGEDFSGYPDATVECVESALKLSKLEKELGPDCRRLVEHFGSFFPETPVMSGMLFGWAFINGFGKDPDGRSHALAQIRMDELGLGELLANTLAAMGTDQNVAQRAVQLVRLHVRYADWSEWDDPTGDAASNLLEMLLGDEDTRRFLGINEFDEIVWFHEESMQALLGGLLRTAAAETIRQTDDLEKAADQLEAACETLLRLRDAAVHADSRIEKLREAIDTD